MLFNSVEFLLFLPIVFLLYWSMFRHTKAQNAFIVAASYLFYGWWDLRFLLLIALTTVCSYASGVFLAQYNDKENIRRIICTANIVLNLSILFVYKYFDFFADGLHALLSTFGIDSPHIRLNMVLPVGISFYTFQALSYTIDVYRRHLTPTRDIIAFFAYISFFPQLVAGPIERATNLLPQFLKPRQFTYQQASEGMRMILWGLFKKMVVADNCAVFVDSTFANYQSVDGGTLMWGGVFFAFQIYGDFSGYSDIAIGTARLFGIRLMRNFHYPYLSRDMAEFWRRWHISLNTWFVDYVYIPLGGSRHGISTTIRNVAIIFLLSGLWHGANCTFVLWGAYNALLLIILILLGKNHKHATDVAAKGHLLPTLTELLQIGITFALTVIGWIIFRAENTAQAWTYIHGILTGFTFTLPLLHKKALMSIAVLTIVEWLQREHAFGLQMPANGIFGRSIVRWIIYYTIFISILIWRHSPENFIYFQF